MKKLLSAALALAIGATCTIGFTACGDNENGINESSVVERVIDGLRAMYMTKYTDANTPNDYEVAGQYPVDGVPYTINWSVDVTEGVVVGEMNQTTKMVTIDVDEKTKVDINYNLTATVEVGKASDSIKFANLKVPKYNVNTNAEYWAAEDGSALNVIGTVSGYATKGDGATGNHIYFQDNDGGYYAYNLSALPEGLAVGDEIEVSGVTKMYYGLQELTDCTVTTISKGNTVTPKDITDVVKAAANNKDASLIAYQCQLVTIKGVTVHNNVTNDTYYGFKLGNVDSYLRISGSDCPTGAENQTAIKTAHAANIGKSATVTGVVAQYNGAFYIVPVSGTAFSEFAESTLTPAEKVAEAKAAVPNLIKTSYADVTTTPVELPSENFGATLVWSVKGSSELVTVAENKLSVVKLPTEDTKVTLSVAISCDTASDTAEVEITVKAAPVVNSGSIVATVDSLKVEGAYKNEGGATINGIEFGWIGMGNYGDGLQMRTNATTGTSSFWNKTAFSDNVKKVVLVWSETKDLPTKTDVLKVEYANSADFANAKTEIISFTDSKTLELTVDGEYKHVRITHNNNGAVYLASVTYVISEEAVGGALKLASDSITILDDSQNSGYAKCNGTRTISGYEITTNQVMANKYAERDVMQFQAEAGKLSLSGEFSKITIVYASTYAYESSNPLAVKVGESTLTAVLVNTDETGEKVGNYDLFIYTIEFTVTGSGVQAIELAKDTKGAGYVLSIDFAA